MLVELDLSVIIFFTLLWLVSYMHWSVLILNFSESNLYAGLSFLKLLLSCLEFIEVVLVVGTYIIFAVCVCTSFRFVPTLQLLHYPPGV
jgi:hypothetical protein